MLTATQGINTGYRVHCLEPEDLINNNRYILDPPFSSSDPMIVETSAGPVSISESNDSASPPPYEAAIAGSVNHLHRSMTTYQEAAQQGREPTEAEAQKVADAMRDVGDTHRDPKIKTDWHRRAEKFIRAPKAGREGILRESGGIVRALLSIPLALLGTALHIAGGAIHAVGSVLGGIGDVVMGSPRDGAAHAAHAPHAFGRARYSRTQDDLNAGSSRGGAPHLNVKSEARE